MHLVDSATIADQQTEPVGLYVAPGTPEADMIVGLLRMTETYTLDALARCAGAPRLSKDNRSAPNYAEADKLRAELDRIDRMCTALGSSHSRQDERADVETYFATQAAIWEAPAPVRAPNAALSELL